MENERASTATESWFRGLCRWHKDQSRSEKEVIGILSFEVASLMSKVVKVWHSLSDPEILRLKSEILRSSGVRNLVSKDEDCLMNMVLDEMLDVVVYVARAVVRLSKKCSDPRYHQIERLFVSPLQHRAEWSWWAYKWKKMDRRVKKMEGFIGSAIKLYDEQEALGECEQTLKRLKVNPELDHGKVFEFQQKTVRQRCKVQKLRELSHWCRTYDYIVRLLLRSLSTILEKVKYTFGRNQELASDGEQNFYMCLSKNYSIPALIPSLLYPSVYNFEDWCEAPPLPDKKGAIKRQNSGHHRNLHPCHLSQVAPFKGCMIVVTDSPSVGSSKSNIGERGGDLVVGDDMGIWNEDKLWLFIANSKILWRLASLYSKWCRFSPPQGTLGHSALQMQYANIIVRIEKLTYSSNSVRLDSKDELYKMLPYSMMTALRMRLRPLITGKLNATALDAAEAEKQMNNIVHVLEWISPLAHNTIRWHSEQGFEKQVQGGAANVLLVQTLYFADQAKTEAEIIQLLVSLSLLCKGNRRASNLSRAFVQEKNRPQMTLPQ